MVLEYVPIKELLKPYLKILILHTRAFILSVILLQQGRYIAYKKECMVKFRLVLRVLYLSVCNRYECFAVQGSASGCFVPSLRRL